MAETLTLSPDPDSRLARWLPYRFLGSELALIFRRRRNLAGLAVLAVVPILMAIAGKSSGGGPDFVGSIVGNGLFVAFAALTVELPLFLPLAIAVIAGDSVAGEANIGTLRCLLTVPAGRTRLLAVKYAAVVIFGFAAVALIAVVGSLIGLALFGGGEMVLLSGTTTGFAGAVGRLLLTCGYLGCGLAALGALGLFVSTLTEQPIGATIAVVLVNLLMIICDTVDRLSWLHPWLITHWWTAFAGLLRDPMATADIGRGLLLFGSYAVVFWLLAWARFTTKDVTS